MVDEVKDYPEDDAEEVVLSRWGKIKQWIEIAMATKKVAMLIWGLVISTGGTALVGAVTNTTPLHDAAVEIGLVDPVLSTEPDGSVDNNDAILDELVQLQAEVMQLHDEMTEHSHAHAHAPHEHDTTHEHQEIDLAHTHAEKPHSHPAAPASAAAIKAEILKWVPENHMGLH